MRAVSRGREGQSWEAVWGRGRAVDVESFLEVNSGKCSSCRANSFLNV